jgi:hypothetical protein
VGGVEIAYTGGAQDLVFSGGIEDDEAGYSAKLRLVVSMTPSMMPASGAGTPSATCTVGSAGLMVGTADPMMGFPAGSASLFSDSRGMRAALP